MARSPRSRMNYMDPFLYCFVLYIGVAIRALS